MSRPAKPALVHYYFDADILGLAKIFVQLRPDVTYPGDPGETKQGRARAACTVTSASVPDREWIPETALHRWLIITRDRHIQENRAEIEVVRTSGARMVTISAPDANTTFGQLEVLMCNWRAIEQLLNEDGPFIYTVTRTGGLVRVPLGGG